jgi:hypothetical protein
MVAITATCREKSKERRPMTRFAAMMPGVIILPKPDVVTN